MRACRLLMAAALLAMPAMVTAQYPDRPVVVVVPFPPGGGGDTLARTVMPRVAQELGQPIVIENKPGAGGNIGSAGVARATPDGYVLLYGTNGTHAINQTLYRKPGFDAEKEFAPVSRLTEIPAVLVVNPSLLPVKSAPELIAYLKANPGKVSFASAGNGTTSHLAGIMFGTLAGVDIQHVPYKGGAQAITDVMGGQVAMMIDVMPNVYPHIKSGKVRALAISTVARSPAAPDLPTIAEAVPGFEVTAWDAVFAPPGTPKAIVERLNAAVRKALDDPAIKETLLARGTVTVAGTPDDLARFVTSENARWGKVVKQIGAQVD
uniref:ABC transporter substrate-binding protein n=1 Tax=uncultured bacterium 5 TaxID=1748277 RepID=A0A0U3T289_9BACT|nr:ABC transporter substrate-binding protein [uncultured bacterium 5]